MRSSSSESEKEPLSAFERRLVHQIVRAEFPELQTSSSKGDFVQVRLRDEEEQTAIRAALHQRLDTAISAQVGFRWIAEAMAGGDLSGLEPGPTPHGIDGDPSTTTPKAYQKRFIQIRNSLKNRKNVLVGHNCFMDLVFFYNQFFGELPDTAKEFQRLIHELFPTVIDTKYIATRDHGRWRSSQLWQIDEALESQAKPVIGLSCPVA